MGWRILVSKIVLLLSSSPFFEYANERPFVGCGMYLLTCGDNILASMYHLDSECRLIDLGFCIALTVEYI